MLTNFKFGITERGDAGLDLSWTDRIDLTAASIIISKAASKDLEAALLKYQNKVIYHATCTGLGSTEMEPNVPSTFEKLEHVKSLIYHGFPASHVVLRIDPLFPKTWIRTINEVFGINYLENINEILKFADEMKIERVRYSYVDFYSHVIQRIYNISEKFRTLEIPKANEYENEIHLDSINPNLLYCSCAEQCVPIWHKVGCISDEDLTVLKIYGKFERRGNQRPFCLCPTNKFELLNHKYRCEHKCAYCYWKDKE